MITTFGRFTDGFHETGNQVHDWVMRQAREHFARDRARRRAVTDAATFEAYRRERRERFLQSIGGLPEERSDAPPTETGRLQRPGYTIRKLVYQSLPSVYVTGLLYVPDGLERPAAAVFMGCGHAPEGKAAPKYQQVCIDLVRSGFVVLVVDAPSQAEMVQCLRPGTAEPLVGINTTEHSHLQLGASIAGQNVARYFICNAMRGIDILASLPEVDADRIGATGNSGGGTLTQYLMMADPRIKAAMPCCSLSSRESYLATGSRAYDGEQNLWGAIPDGVDYADFLAAFAPRPLRIGVAEYDFFAIEGAEESVEEARSIYRALGAGDAIDLCVAPEELHGYSTPLRRGCVDWFARHLQGRVAGPFEDEPAVEPPEALRCTGAGQVMLEFPDARSILDLTREAWEAKRAGAGPLSREAVAAVIGGGPSAPLRPRRTTRVETPQGSAEHVFFFTEPGILTTAVVYVPHDRPRRAALLLIPDGTEGQEAYRDAIAERAGSGQLVMVFDVRGTGAVRMHRRNAGEGLAFRSTEFRVASDHFLLATSLAARRAYDVKRALEYLRQRPDVGDATPVEIAAHGWPAIYGLLAACTEPSLAPSTFDGLPDSWSAAFAPSPRQPERIAEPLIVPEFAGAADLADLRRLATAG